MPAIRAPPVHHSFRSSNAYMGFLTGFDDRVSLPRVLTSSEGYYSDADHHHYDGSPLAHWIGSSSTMPDFEGYEPMSQCLPPFINTTNDEPFNRYDDPYDSHSAPFYDSASSSSGSPFNLHETFSLNTMSPSISVTSSSPRSEPGALSPPMHEFPQFFDFDYGSSSSSLGPESFTPSSSWSTSRLSPISNSPSPSPSFSSLDNSDIKPILSRDHSPVTGETAKPDRRRFPCMILGCNRRFTSQYTLKVHMEAHKPKPRVSFPCTEGCAERFSRQHDRLRHEVAKHGKVCEFLCDDCGRFFSTKKTLGNHKCPVAQGGTRWVSS